MFCDLSIDHVWLIGSAARGENDPTSDLDILLVSKDDISSELKLQLGYSYPPKTNFDICFYTPRGIESVVRNGSLFGWHIKREGIPLYDKNNWFQLCLNQIAPYGNHLNDLKLLLCLSLEVFESICESDLALKYDAGVISTSIRNSSIVMTDLFGSPDFSPRSYLTLKKMSPSSLHAPLTELEYDLLLACRRESERGALSKMPISKSSLFDIAQRVISWQEECIEFLSERNRND